MIKVSSLVDSTYVFIKSLFKSDNFIIIIGVVSILPFIIIALYNHPIADDFTYNIESRNRGYWGAQIFWYTKISGKYFTSLILSIKPLVSHNFLIYKFIPILLISSLFYALFSLISLLFKNLRIKDRLVFVFFVFSVYLIQMPLVSQGFYWLSSSIAYQLSNVLVIFLLIHVIKIIISNSLRDLIISIILLFVIIGLNETSVLIIDYLLVSIFIGHFVFKKRLNYHLLILLIFGFLFSLLVYFAPGNLLRANDYPDKNNLFFAILSTIRMVKRYLFIWLPLIIVFGLIFYNHVERKIEMKDLKLFNSNPIFVLMVICGIPVVGFFTSFWAIGIIPPLRTINSIYFIFLIGIIYFMFSLVLKLSRSKSDLIQISNLVKFSLMILLTLQLLQEKNVKTAYSDLYRGTAYKYDKELKYRYEIIKENRGRDTCYVPKLINKPLTIFVADIARDSKEWRNITYSMYWNSSPIVLRKE